MKKSLLTIVLAVTFSILFSNNVMAQAKSSPEKAKSVIEQPRQDTLFVFTLKDFKEYATMIDQNVDSKDVTRKLIAYIEQRGRIITQQPADKPKPIKP